MPIPLLYLTWGLTALGALALEGCASPEAKPGLAPRSPKSPPPPPPKGPPSCAGDRFVEGFGGHAVAFCHGDASGDGRFQAGNETLWASVDGQVAHEGSAAYREFQKKFGFPNFRGLNLKQWRQARGYIYSLDPKEWSLPEERFFSEVFALNQKNGLDLKPIIQIASGFQGANPILGLTPKEKIYTLLLSGIYLQIQKDKNSPLHGDYPDFIPEVLQAVQNQKLKLTDRGGFETDPERINKYGAIYIPNKNQMVIFIPPKKISSTWIRSAFVHESFHLYQDIRKKPMTVLDSEMGAYLAQAKYILRLEGLDRPGAKIDQVEAYIQRELADQYWGGLEHPIFSALRAAHYRFQHSAARFEYWLGELKQNLVLNHMLATLSVFWEEDQVAGDHRDKMLKSFFYQFSLSGTEGQEEQLKYLEVFIERLKMKKDFYQKEFSGVMTAGKVQTGEAMSYLELLFRSWAALIRMKKYRYQMVHHLDPRNNGKHRAQLEAYVMENIREMAQEMEPWDIYRFFKVPFDGVD